MRDCAYRSTIVLVAEDPVGRLYLHRGGQHYRVIDISLLPPWRNRGIGTQLLRNVQSDARAHGCKVSMQVDIANRAQRLYLRLGFKAVADMGIRVLMEC